MAIRKVARMGHPVLREKAQALSASDIRSAEIQRLIDDMFETMGEYEGIGLAAPQVYEGVRIFVAGTERALPIGAMSDDGPMPRFALINPELTAEGRAIELDWEGCLSIPDIRGKVPRPRDITVRGFNREGEQIGRAHV